MQARATWLVGLAWVSLIGCAPSRSDREVIVYAALDAEFSEPILRDFTEQSGIPVRPKFDVESTKTVGLTQAIIAEQARPRCDVFWNNEILNTLRLEERGLLEAHIPPTAAEYPAAFRSINGQWHGFAARARVLIVNTELAAPGDRPDSIYDLADRRWKGKCGLAKPLFGTTATQAACLFSFLGADKAKRYFRDVKANEARILSGNKQVALAVAAGELVFGLTDTDDAIIEVEHGRPVTIVYPDQGANDLGTLFIPNTLSIIKGCPHPAEARRLVDFLLTPAIEQRLAAGPSAQIPLHPSVEVELRVETPRTIRAMPVDFAAALQKWDETAEFLREEFTAE
jgi:iron(III) transport system substrate-binding protein